ncbi:hypothetical protein CL655_04095 [bacterium]|nr:hypothetical protein [bacterium]|tara:strand:- start:4560 stop:4766 length:207 start_codon:yes stop_codon:yes gene_type:complete
MSLLTVTPAECELGYMLVVTYGEDVFGGAVSNCLECLIAYAKMLISHDPYDRTQPIGWSVTCIDPEVS